MAKKQEIELSVEWVPFENPEQAEQALKAMAEFLARAMRPDFFKAVDEAKETVRRADELIKSTDEFLASTGKPEQRDEVQARIDELEAEIARLKAQQGKPTEP